MLARSNTQRCEGALGCSADAVAATSTGVVEDEALHELKIQSASQISLELSGGFNITSSLSNPTPGVRYSSQRWLHSVANGLISEKGDEEFLFRSGCPPRTKGFLC